MASRPYIDEELVMAVGGQRRTALVRTPDRVTPGGVLCLNLAMDRAFTLDTAPYNIVTDIFLAAGVDIFADLAMTARVMLDECIRRGWARAGRVVVCGTSRGGHAALCLLAADARLLAAAVHAPVTDLPALQEFAELADNPIVRHWTAPALALQLADRPVFLHIGEEDPRVNAASCFDLHARLTAASRVLPPTLYTLPGSTHGAAFLEPGYHAAAAFLLARCADAIKGEK